MGRSEVITSYLKPYDRLLYCDISSEGTLRVCRKTTRFETYDVDGVNIAFSRPSYHVIFYLTDNWRANGKPVPWGIEPILAKIRAGDTHQRDLVAELERQDNEEQKSRDRWLDNYTESFCKDIRKEFARAHNDVRVANMDTSMTKRRREEKKIKNR